MSGPREAVEGAGGAGRGARASEAEPPPPRGMRIGLEAHAYLATASKMFCPCPNRFWSAEAEPNTLVCAVCTAQPGAKPMAPNAAALRHGLRIARTLGCEVDAGAARGAVFLRKHYFYPDLPSNYQRTGEPFATGGSVAGVRLREVHWEEDPGAYDPRAGLVDFNRSGAPLLEVVTEPEVRSPAHAREVLEELRLALTYLGALSPAGMKADANLSLEGGERVEVKNLNSARNVELALAHEAERQAALLAEGKAVARETRHFDETFLRTVPLRAKESEADYRYLPDPDLPPVDLTAVRAEAESALPPEPFGLRAGWMRDLGVTKEAADVVLGEPGMPATFAALSADVAPRAAFDFLVRDLKGELNYRGLGLATSAVALDELRDLLRALAAGEVTRKQATGLLRTRLDRGAQAFAEALRAEREAAVGAGEVEAAVRAALAAHPKAVEDHQRGNAKAANRIIGEAMKALRGRAPPDAVREAVLAALERGGGPPGGEG